LLTRTRNTSTMNFQKSAFFMRARRRKIVVKTTLASPENRSYVLYDVLCVPLEPHKTAYGRGPLESGERIPILHNSATQKKRPASHALRLPTASLRRRLVERSLVEHTAGRARLRNLPDELKLPLFEFLRSTHIHFSRTLRDRVLVVRFRRLHDTSALSRTFDQKIEVYKLTRWQNASLNT